MTPFITHLGNTKYALIKVLMSFIVAQNVLIKAMYFKSVRSEGGFHVVWVKKRGMGVLSDARPIDRNLEPKGQAAQRKYYIYRQIERNEDLIIDSVKIDLVSHRSFKVFSMMLDQHLSFQSHVESIKEVMSKSNVIL